MLKEATAPSVSLEILAHYLTWVLRMPQYSSADVRSVPFTAL